MKKKVEFKCYKPFGPSILETKIPDETVIMLNNYIDKIVEDKKKSSELNYGKRLVGDVTQEFLLEKEIMEKSGWSQFLANMVAKWIEIETGKRIKKFTIIGSWVVRQFQNEYNPAHWHNGHVSGAGFLKVPKSLGGHTQKDKSETKRYSGGSLQLLNGTRHFMSASTKTIKPEVGNFYFFPHYLMHTVYPFKDTLEERRSISFNAEVDGEIYDVYSK